jgi:hypothetical protein
MDNLPELRDIHLPLQGVSAFPPAKGWWIVLVLLVGSFLLMKLFFRIRRSSAKIYARHLLQKITATTDLAAVVQISELLRRICLRRYPTAVALFGKDWIRFLNEKSSQKIEGKIADLLVNAPFMPTADNSVTPDDVAALKRFCAVWIGENL